MTSALPHTLATVLALAGAAATLPAGPAFAQNEQSIAFEIAPQALSDAIRALARASGRSIIASAELVENRNAPRVSGRYEVAGALAVLLEGTGLRARRVGSTFIVEREPDAARSEPAVDREAAIIVTGTRLRGVPVASTVVTVARDDIFNSAQANLGDVARDLPQSFGGGQNPGVGFNVPSTSGVNVGSGSSFNLRGLGSDATLTLLNGRRLPYSSSAQSIDISAVPVLAIDRIEIVPDGSSALYGSDAVAGVVNIILRDRFEGLETSARLAGSADGGNIQQQYTALAGTTWASGGGFAAYEFEDVSEIRSDQRDYAASRTPGQVLVPPRRSHRVLGSLKQSLFSGVTIAVDALYNTRDSGLLYALNPEGDLDVSRTRQEFEVETYALAPSLSAALGPWAVTLAATLGRDTTEFRGESFAGDVSTFTAQGRYTNRSRSLELAAVGPILALPGGSLQLAAGAGLRVNEFSFFSAPGSPSNIEASQNSRFVFGEIGVPIVSSDMAVPLVDQLRLTAAFRHEDYRDIGAVTTPKLGAIYAPAPGVLLKASWGRSFRAPTFIQQFQVRQAALFPTGLFAGSGFPAGSTALVLFGGNRTLAPEKASSWSITAAVTPRAIEGLDASVTWFSTRYIDRIVNPVTFLALALSDPLYADQVTLAPSRTQQAELIASADQFFNFTEGGYDPAQVVAVVNTANVNAGRQRIRGVDALVTYAVPLQGEDTLTLLGNVSYLKSDQQLTPLQPVQDLSGRLFNPPHWRARGSVTWTDGPLGATATLSRIGGVIDPRTTPAIPVRGMTLFDLSARYSVPAGSGVLAGLQIALAAQNLFDASPTPIAVTAPTDTPYDSTNFSPAGRVISIRVAKSW